MPSITFILLAHERSDDVADLVTALIEGDSTCHVVIHYDAKSSDVEFEKLQNQYRGQHQVFFVEKRLACGWGEFSLVEATVRALRLIQQKQINPGHVCLLSGSCMPVRPLAELHAFLDAQQRAEYIESETKDWITGGLRDERHQFWFPVGYKSHNFLFSLLTQIQKRLKVKRRFPAGLQPRFGSQWWCLTWETCEKILDWIQNNPRGYRYFKTVWIPDECFFQTLAWKFAQKKIVSRPLTFYRFNNYGKPLVFHEDHRAFLTELPYFFARKVSYQARDLRNTLKAIALAPARTPPALTPLTFEPLFYRSLVAGPQFQVKSGQLFHPNQALKAWPGNLQNFPGSFAVLVGPPDLTRFVAGILRNCPGITVMGRLLHPREVDFGPGVDELGVLRRQDIGIRNLDPALYLTRVFERVPHFPVFELAPTDAPVLLQSLGNISNAIVLPVRPLSNAMAYASLFWLLSIPDREKAARHVQRVLGDNPTQQERQRALSKLLDEAVSKKVMDAINSVLFHKEPTSEPRMIALVGESPACSLDHSTIEFRHGSSARALADAAAKLDQELSRRTPDEIADFLPPYWQEHFSALLRRTPSQESHNEVFQRD